MVIKTTFQRIFDRWQWKPIRNCPGRYIFAEGRSDLTLSEIAESELRSFEYSTNVVPDQVIVMKFPDGGGLISYRKGENSFLHTLNDKDGFLRKLAHLQIEI